MADFVGQITNSVTGVLAEESGGAPAEEESATHDAQATQPLDILLRDYYAKVGSSERLNDGIGRMAGTALPIMLTLFGLLTVNKGLAAEVFWLIPLALVLLVGVLMQLIYRSVLISYYLRDLENRIQEMTGTTPFYFENMTGRALYSPRTGTPAFLVLYGMYFVVVAAAHFGLIIYCFRALQMKSAISPILGACYIGFYSLTTAVMIWALVFYLTGMRRLYDRWAKALEGQAAAPRDTQTFSLLRYMLLPRPFDFFVKTPITLGNALIAAYLLRVSLMGHWALLAGVVLCVEFFTKQATYIWNDLLDAEADRTHKHKKRRYFAVVESNALGKPLLVSRTLAAFGVAAALAIYAGLVALLPLVVAIFFVQFLYDRYAKPYPPARLGLAALAYAERSVAGAIVPASIAASGSSSSPVRVVVLLSVWTVAFALLFLGASWYAEDDFRLRTGSSAYASRDGRSWFLMYGARIEVAASLALVPLGLWMSGLRQGTIHRWFEGALIGGGLIGVAVVWSLLTISGRRQWRGTRKIVARNGRTAGEISGCTVPEWNRYVLYVVIAVAVGGYLLAFRSAPRFPFVMTALFPVTVATIYAYATYEELNFLNLKPTLIFTVHVLNQLVFTKKTFGEIRRGLRPIAPDDAMASHASQSDSAAHATIPLPDPSVVHAESPASQPTVASGR